MRAPIWLYIWIPPVCSDAPDMSGAHLTHLFWVGLAWHTIVIYHSAISTFLEPHHLHKASNHPVIFKLMHHLYLQHPPSHKTF